MSRPLADRAIAAALALVSLGLVAAVYAVWTQQARIDENQALIRQQQEALNVLAAQTAQAQQEREQLRSLVQALQRQVRSLGGQPLTEVPASRTRPGPSGAGVGPSTSAPPAATGTPSPSRPSPRPSQPTVSPTPTSSPSPDGRVCVASICLPPGGGM